jgi:hypothetical protein
MTFVKYAVAVLAVALVAAQPCAAASDAPDYNERRAGAFAGFNVRMALGGAKPARPSARLQLTTAFELRDSRTGAARTLKAQGLEIGANRKGAPAFYLNGRNAAERQEAHLLSSSTSTTTWIVLSVALVAVGVLVLSNSAELPGPIV